MSRFENKQSFMGHLTSYIKQRRQNLTQKAWFPNAYWDVFKEKVM